MKNIKDQKTVKNGILSNKNVIGAQKNTVLMKTKQIVSNVQKDVFHVDTI